MLEPDDGFRPASGRFGAGQTKHGVSDERPRRRPVAVDGSWTAGGIASRISLQELYSCLERCAVMVWVGVMIAPVLYCRSYA